MTKSKKKTPEEEEAIVWDFMQAKNRPFSLQNITDALQKHGVKKSAVERSLATLLKKESITKKEYGKAKVFIRNQATTEVPDPEQTAKVTSRIRELRDAVKTLDEHISETENGIREMRRELTLERARQVDKELQERISQLEAKLESTGSGQRVSKEEMDEARNGFVKTKAEWKKRKTTVLEILSVISEASGKRMNELYKDCLIDTDEDAKVDIKQLPDIKVGKETKNVTPAKRKRNAA